MLRTGLVSVTFRQLTPAQIVDLAVQAGLDAIEWGGDVHVPHGDTHAAREVLALTKTANLSVAAYGSYYRVGHSEDEGLSFRHVLHTALELEAPVVRVWAGKQDAEDSDDVYRRLITRESRYICDLAAQVGVLVAYEFHGGTLTNNAMSARQLLEDVDHPSLRALWQPRVGASTPEAKADLQLLLPWLSHLHVFQWEDAQRRPFAEGVEAWREYLMLAASAGKPVHVLLEFVQNDTPQQFLEDARTLENLVESLQVANPAA